MKVIIAAGTQFIAEWNSRGQYRIIAEIDFVVAGILTAIVGKVREVRNLHNLFKIIKV